MRWLLKRWWAWALAVLGATVLVAAVALIAAGGSTITEANCNRIVKGMTLQEVESLLGRPPDYSNPNGGHFWDYGLPGDYLYSWRDEIDHAIIVGCDSERRILAARFINTRLSLQECLRRLVRKVLRL